MTTVQSHTLALFPEQARSLASTAWPLAQDGGGASTEDAEAQALGRDFARLGIALPVAHWHAHSPLAQAYTAARQGRLGAAARPQPDPQGLHRRWLMVRLQAWSEGARFDLASLNAHYLAQLDRSHCPVTRERLVDEEGHDNARCTVRLHPQANYSAGHLVVLSRRAARALGQRNLQRLEACAQQAALNPSEPHEGLLAAAWERLVDLVRCVTPLPPEASSLPLCVLPSNRLHLQNPAHALQAWISHQLRQPGWSQRLQVFIEALALQTQRQAAVALVAALSPRALLSLSPAPGNSRTSMGSNPNPNPNAITTTWALEDLWRDARVARRWTALLESLSPTSLQRLETLVQSLPAPAGWHTLTHRQGLSVQAWAA